MQTITTTPEIDSGAGMAAKGGTTLPLTIEHTYHVECWRPVTAWANTAELDLATARFFACDAEDCGAGCARCNGTGQILKARVWTEDFHNLVTTVGKNKYLDATLKTGLTTPAWYIGLVTGPGGSNTYAAGDTSASHAGWTENTGYSNSTRVAWTPGSVSAGSVDNSGSPAVFNMNASYTVGGGFMIDNSTKGGSTGTLLGVGSFTGGDKAGGSGDTITVTVTATMS